MGGHVSSLSLSGNGLAGAIPAKIRNLPYLDTLEFSGNRITDFPAEISSLNELETLHLSDNALTSVPTAI